MILIDLIDERRPETRPEKEQGRGAQAAACPGDSQENLSSESCLNPLNDRRQRNLLRLFQAGRLLKSIPVDGLLRSLL